jgi:hypothetical protein
VDMGMMMIRGVVVMMVVPVVLCAVSVR